MRGLRLPPRAGLPLFTENPRRVILGSLSIKRGPRLLDPGLLSIAALPLGGPRDALPGGEVGTEGYQRGQDMQDVVPDVEREESSEEPYAKD